MKVVGKAKAVAFPPHIVTCSHSRHDGHCYPRRRVPPRLGAHGLSRRNSNDAGKAKFKSVLENHDKKTPKFSGNKTCLT
jgi:hypothetical protein